MVAVIAIMPMVGLANQNSRPDIQVNVPPEVFSARGRSSQPCIQCCVCGDQELLRRRGNKSGASCSGCQRDEKTISTNPLVWRRVKP
ncbi:DUF1496 domain-containing protein [Salmonella enterica subsp. enterica]|nr:DUF1496 domain-containing protein [Salmonella enterica subsp. enterica]